MGRNHFFELIKLAPVKRRKTKNTKGTKDKILLRLRPST